MNDKESSRVLKDAIVDVPGIKVGHGQDLKAGTGCTVIICEKEQQQELMYGEELRARGRLIF